MSAQHGQRNTRIQRTLWIVVIPILLLGFCWLLSALGLLSSQMGRGLFWMCVITLLWWWSVLLMQWQFKVGAPPVLVYLGTHLITAAGLAILLSLVGLTLAPNDLGAPLLAGVCAGTAWLAISAAFLLRSGDSNGNLFWRLVGSSGSGSSKGMPVAEAPQRNPTAVAAPAVVSAAAPPMVPVAVSSAGPASRPAPISAARVEAAPALYKSQAKTKEAAVPDPKSPCPHGRRRRDQCPICDPDGFRFNFGDWRSD